MSNVKNTSQIQVRIDANLKEEARKILDEMGLDISTAVKIMCKQIVNSRSFPIELRDENGFRAAKSAELRTVIQESEKNKGKKYTNTKELLDDLMS